MIEEILKSTRKSSYYQKNQSVENTMFRIVCKNCNLALRPQIRQKKDPNDEIKIMGSIEKNDSIKQLWMFKPLKEGKYQIVNFWTDSVIQSDLQGVRLDRGMQISSQKFQVQFVDRRYNILLQSKREIRIKDSSGKYLTLDGILDGAKFDEVDEAQIYVLKQANPEQYKEFQDTYMLIQAQSKLCLDVEQGSEQSGAIVSLYHNHRRANQRWLFEPELISSAPEDVKYSIINLLSGKRLWFSQDKDLIQFDNHERIWQIKKKHDFSGELYCTKKQKYLNRVQDDKLVFQSNSNGTKWNII